MKRRRTLRSILQSRPRGAAGVLAEEVDRAVSTIWSWTNEGATVDSDGTIRSASERKTVLGVMKLSDSDYSSPALKYEWAVKERGESRLTNNIKPEK